jgi:dihydrofolate reductase (trimethoprim resistance protein)
MILGHKMFKETHKTYDLGDCVKKKSGSEWEGKVVGFYSTKLTPEGYAVESMAHEGSVQIYPVNALERGWDY